MEFVIRSKNYLKTRKKEPSKPPLARTNCTKVWHEEPKDQNGDLRLTFIIGEEGKNRLYVTADFSWIDNVVPERWDFFLGLEDKEKNKKFKVIALLHRAPSFFQRLVNSRPAILGNLLTTEYIRREDSLEIIFHTYTSRLARFICGRIFSLVKHTTIDVETAFLLEESDEEHLPERILGKFRISDAENLLEEARKVEVEENEEDEIDFFYETVEEIEE